jgi:divalent metal cation (Fe/Co/Zn/Cd) transporter
MVRDRNDSKEAITCAFQLVALLIGLGANYLFGFWQADPLAGIVIVLFVFLFREGTRDGQNQGMNRQTE